MIIAWNTDPSQGHFEEGSTKFSSYYQYDTVSRKFVRIRLELGRAEGSGQTRVIYDEDRVVGFSDIDYTEKENAKKYPDKDFTIDEQTGKLLVKGNPLPLTRKPGQFTVDMSPGDAGPHFGNPVSADAHLPAGIQNRHLSVLANEAVLNEKGGILTASGASAADLSAALKAAVADVVGKPFAEISDEDLLETLQKQVAEIRQNETSSYEESMGDSLKEVDGFLDLVKSQITDEGLVPTEDFEKAFDNLSVKQQAAQEAWDSGVGMKEAMTALSAAKETFNTEVTKLEAKYQDALEEQVTQSDKAIETATSDAEAWEGIETEYAGLEDASSIDEYEAEMSAEEAEAV